MECLSVFSFFSVKALWKYKSNSLLRNRALQKWESTIPCPICCGWPSESRCRNSHKRSNGALWDTSAWKRDDLRGNVTETNKIWRCMKQMGRDCLFLPLPMQELEAYKCRQISNKWWELVLDVAGRRPREFLIRGCCGYKVYSCAQRKATVFETKIVRDHWIDKLAKAKKKSSPENDWRLSK